jgi:hypothetical protein
MNIEIRDEALAAGIQKQQDRWLLVNRELNDEKICRGLEQLERGEGMPEDELDGYLARLKTTAE